ncbi:MAG: adenine deaminase [Terrimonas sp.]|nr:adenine deaminase [Terrimonas sp.]
MTQKITGKVADISNKRFVAAEITVSGAVITGIREILPGPDCPDQFIIPGFIDSHVHIESSMLVPSEFARLAVVQGTVATVSDPHEIANVCGREGVEFMIANGKTVPFKFFFGAPSCVPATRFETAGAALDAREIEQLLSRDEIKYLSEMMNFPGVLQQDETVMKKIAAAKKHGKPVDGHAPGMRGEDVINYTAAGISTDHECFSREEALDKLQAGMKILIREGSAAKNFEALIGLLQDYPDQIMFCSDDKHPDSLLTGHINQLCARAVKKGIDIFKILQAACINPVQHYQLEVGQLQPGDPADFIVVKDLVNFEVLQTYINGEMVAHHGQTKITSQKIKPINNFSIQQRTVSDFSYSINKWGEEENIEQVYVIEALEGQLITHKLVLPVTDLITDEKYLYSNPEKDIVKIVVVNRYHDAPIAKSFIRNFGIQKGAIASSVAHDSHNIVAIGVDDESICKAVNLIIAKKGGISAVGGDQEMVLGLPVAGLMSDQDGYSVADAYTAIDRMVKAKLGSTLAAPFMTLSFMALLVIPHLKLSDMGLFDGDHFKLI